jgi:hypothetical protein
MSEDGKRKWDLESVAKGYEEMGDINLEIASEWDHELLIGLNTYK